MKIHEIRELGIEELKIKEKSLAEDLFKLRIRHGTGQLDSPANLREAKRDIARVKTVLKEKGAE